MVVTFARLHAGAAPVLPKPGATPAGFAHFAECHMCKRVTGGMLSNQATSSSASIPLLIISVPVRTQVSVPTPTPALVAVLGVKTRVLHSAWHVLCH